MMISLFDLIWIDIIVVTTAGSMAYCAIAGRQHVQDKLEELKGQVEHQRNRKKFWKAKAKNSPSTLAGKEQGSTISMNSRSMGLRSSAGAGH